MLVILSFYHESNCIDPGQVIDYQLILLSVRSQFYKQGHPMIFLNHIDLDLAPSLEKFLDVSHA